MTGVGTGCCGVFVGEGVGVTFAVVPVVFEEPAADAVGVGVTLTWDQAGQTLSLFVSRGGPPEAADPLSIARTVKKIEEE